MYRSMRQPENIVYIIYKEIVVLKNRQYTYVGNEAKYQIPLAPRPPGIFYEYSGYVVYNNCTKKYNNVDRHKCHIEYTTGHQQMKPPEPMRQQEVQCRNNGEKQ